MSSSSDFSANIPSDLPEDPLFTYSPGSTYGPLPPREKTEAAPDSTLPTWSVALDPKKAQEIATAETLAPETAAKPGKPRPGEAAPAGAVQSSQAAGGQEEGEESSWETRGPSSSAATPSFESEAEAYGRRPSPAKPASGGPVYTLSQRVARGGMGEIWEARQASLGGRIVAVKRIREDVLALADPDERERMEMEFQQEALAAARLEHPGIVPVHDLGAGEDGLPLMAMKLVRGDPWDAMLKRDFAAKLPVADFLAKHLPTLVDMAQAVAFAHSQGIVHRDLKPAQVMAGRFGETLLMDWGLAVFVPDAPGDGGEGADAPDLSGLPTCETASNPAGTPALMAPEQTLPDAKKVGPWTDVFLLGGTLYWMLAGSYPFSAPNATEAFRKAAMGEFEPPSERAPDRFVPSELERLCLKALARQPKDRTPSAEAFVEALQDYLSGASKRRESERIAAEAQASLQTLLERAPGLEAADLYVRHGAVADQLGRALLLWPGNVQAAEADARNLAARAAVEIAEGDLLLARVHLNSLAPAASRGLFDLAEAQALDQRLEQALLDRERAKLWRRVLSAAAAVFFAAALGFGALALLSAREADARAREASRERDNARQAQAEATRERDNAEASRLQAVEARDAEEAARLDAENARDLSEASEAEATRQRDAAEASRQEALEARDAEEAARLEAENAREAEEAARQAAERGLAIASEQGEGAYDLVLFIFDDLKDSMEAELTPERGLALADANAIKHAIAGAVAEQALGYFDRLDYRGWPDDLQRVHAGRLLLTAQSLNELGRYKEASELAAASVELAEERIGPDSPALVSALNALATALDKRGFYDSAESSLRRALEIQEKAGRAEEAATAKIFSRLAAILSTRQDLDAAEPFYRQALAIFEKEYGPDHSGTAGAAAGLADLLASRGAFQEAETLYRQALAHMEKNPEENPRLLGHVLGRLAVTRANLGAIGEGVELQRRGLAIQEKASGPGHPETAAALHNLALLLKAKGDFPEAIAACRRSLDIRQKTLGPGHADTAASMAMLATLLGARGEVLEAEALFRETVSILETVHGPDHPDVAATLNNLANLLRARGDLAGAEALCRRVLAINENVKGPDHPHLAFILGNLGLLCADQGKFQEAEEFSLRALAITEKAFGPEHPDLASFLANLANVSIQTGKLGEAEERLERALAIQEKALGPDHPFIADTLNGLFAAAYLQGDIGKALKVNDRLLSLWGGLAERDPENARWRENLGAAFYNAACLLARSGEADKAFASLEESAGHGWGNWAEAMADADLAPLREADLERFAAAMARMRDNAASQQ